MYLAQQIPLSGNKTVSSFCFVRFLVFAGKSWSVSTEPPCIRSVPGLEFEYDTHAFTHAFPALCMFKILVVERESYRNSITNPTTLRKIRAISVMRYAYVYIRPTSHSVHNRKPYNLTQPTLVAPSQETATIASNFTDVLLPLHPRRCGRHGSYKGDYGSFV